MKTNSLLIVVLFSLFQLFPCTLFSQTPMAFSLKQAQEYAFENNFDLRNAAYDVQYAQKEVRKNTAIGLPQISGSVDYMDNFVIPTTVIPNFLSFLDTTGNAPQFLELQFGTRYNLSLSGTVTQLLYSGTYIVGLQTAQAYLETVKQKMIRDRMDVRDLVAQAYIGLLIIEESATILDSTYKTISQMVFEAEQSYKAGLIEDIDVDQLDLNKSNLEASLMNIKNQRDIAYSYLKFVMGVKGGEEIVLTDNLDFFLGEVNLDYLVNKPFDINYNIDFTLLKKQEYLVYMQYKLAKTAYQPSLIAFLGATTTAMRQNWDFTNTHQPWFGSMNWGASLSIPIWSSGQRKNSVDQARINVDKSKVNEEKTVVGLNLQVETARKDFINSYNIFVNNKKGLETSKKIYDKTIEKYRLGVSGSTDLNQKYNQFLQNESNYVQSIYDLLKVRIRLNKLLERV